MGAETSAIWERKKNVHASAQYVVSRGFFKKKKNYSSRLKKRLLLQGNQAVFDKYPFPMSLLFSERSVLPGKKKRES